MPTRKKQCNNTDFLQVGHDNNITAQQCIMASTSVGPAITYTQLQQDQFKVINAIWARFDTWHDFGEFTIIANEVNAALETSTELQEGIIKTGLLNFSQTQGQTLSPLTNSLLQDYINDICLFIKSKKQSTLAICNNGIDGVHDGNGFERKASIMIEMLCVRAGIMSRYLSTARKDIADVDHVKYNYYSQQPQQQPQQQPPATALLDASLFELGSYGHAASAKKPLSLHTGHFFGTVGNEYSATRKLENFYKLFCEFYGLNNLTTNIYLVADANGLKFEEWIRAATKHAIKSGSPGSPSSSLPRIKMFCNMTKDWDSAPGKCKAGHAADYNTIKNDLEKVAYNIERIELDTSRQVKLTSSTVVTKQQSMDNIPKEKNELRDCIIATTNKKCNNLGNVKTNLAKLDIKRSGDGMQVLTAKQANETAALNNNPNNEFYIFLTRDILASTKARMNGVPTCLTGSLNEKTIILYKGNTQITSPTHPTHPTATHPTPLTPLIHPVATGPTLHAVISETLDKYDQLFALYFALLPTTPAPTPTQPSSQSFLQRIYKFFFPSPLQPIDLELLREQILNKVLECFTPITIPASISLQIQAIATKLKTSIKKLYTSTSGPPSSLNMAPFLQYYFNILKPAGTVDSTVDNIIFETLSSTLAIEVLYICKRVNLIGKYFETIETYKTKLQNTFATFALIDSTFIGILRNNLPKPSQPLQPSQPSQQSQAVLVSSLKNTNTNSSSWFDVADPLFIKTLEELDIDCKRFDYMFKKNGANKFCIEELSQQSNPAILTNMFNFNTDTYKKCARQIQNLIDIANKKIIIIGTRKSTRNTRNTTQTKRQIVLNNKQIMDATLDEIKTKAMDFYKTKIGSFGLNNVSLKSVNLNNVFDTIFKLQLGGGGQQSAGLPESDNDYKSLVFSIIDNKALQESVFGYFEDDYYDGLADINAEYDNDKVYDLMLYQYYMQNKDIIQRILYNPQIDFALYAQPTSESVTLQSILPIDYNIHQLNSYTDAYFEKGNTEIQAITYATNLINNNHVILLLEAVVQLYETHVEEHSKTQLLSTLPYTIAKKMYKPTTQVFQNIKHTLEKTPLSGGANESIGKPSQKRPATPLARPTKHSKPAISSPTPPPLPAISPLMINRDDVFDTMMTCDDSFLLDFNLWLLDNCEMFTEPKPEPEQTQRPPTFGGKYPSFSNKMRAMILSRFFKMRKIVDDQA